jgi:O-antigen/teichoic acid export membrane protein
VLAFIDGLVWENIVSTLFLSYLIITGMATKEQQVKNSFIYLLPVIVGNLLPLLTLPIFTRILTKEDYGALALAQVYGIFMSGIANFGLILGYERNFFEHKEEKEAAELLYSTLLFVITTFLICLIFTYLFKSSLSKWIIGSSNQASLLFWAFCSTGTMNLKIYCLTYFKNMENAKSLVWYTIDESVLGVVLSLFFVVYLRVGVIGLVWGQFIASLVIFSILAFRFLKILPISFNFQILKSSLMLSYPLTPSILFKVIGTQFDKYMIGLLASIGGVGIYSIGQKIANIVFTYMTAIENVFSPQVYRRMFDLGEKGGEAVGRYLTPFVYVSILIALVISLFAEEIIMILTPESFHGAIDIVIILYMLYGSYFFGKQPQLLFAKKTYISSALSLTRIALNVAINIPFIMKWGAMGAAYGMLTAGLISGSIHFIVSQHYYTIKWEYKKILSVYIIFFVSSVIILLFRLFIFDYSIRLVAKVIFLGSYLYLGTKIKVVTAENFIMVKNMFNPKRSILLSRQ